MNLREPRWSTTESLTNGETVTSALCATNPVTHCPPAPELPAAVRGVIDCCHFSAPPDRPSTKPFLCSNPAVGLSGRLHRTQAGVVRSSSAVAVPNGQSHA